MPRARSTAVSPWQTMLATRFQERPSGIKKGGAITAPPFTRKKTSVLEKDSAHPDGIGHSLDGNHESGTAHLDVLFF